MSIVRFDSEDISTHAPARGATPLETFAGRHALISTHAPARGATFFVPALHSARPISTHAPARGATRVLIFKFAVAHFISTHAPARGATGAGRWRRRVQRYFNPRSRTGSDSPRSCSRGTQGISTHAPARGATRVRDAPTRAVVISTHAPARGATRSCPCRSWSRGHFNPRSRTGSDIVRWHFHHRQQEFQPTLPHGERRTFFAAGVGSAAFQPTLPHGERRGGLDFGGLVR